MDPIAAPASALQPSDRLIIRMSGDGVIEHAQRRFRPRGGAPPSDLPRWAWPGWFQARALLSLLPGELWVFRGPRSPTGEDTAELHLPGHPLALEFLMADLARDGVRLAAPGEFTRRAVKHGKLDLMQAEGVLALVRAEDEGERAHGFALLALGLSRRVASLRARVQSWLIPLELSFDFSDQGIELPEAPGAQALRQELLQEVQALARAAEPQGATHSVPEVVLIGPPNAGKSSLFNALLGEDRALASPIPGTTRDWLSAEVDLGGRTCRLIDTAGEAEVRAGWEHVAAPVRRALVMAADLVVEVFDLRQGIASVDDAARIFVGTHADLVPEESRPPRVICVSSVNGEGLSDLRLAVATRLSPSSARQEGRSWVTARQAAAFHATEQALTRALLAQEHGNSAELIAADLHLALAALSEVTGEDAREDVLDRVFREFCIGK